MQYLQESEKNDCDISLLIIFIFIKFNEKGGGREKIHYE